ncbi:SRPBCC family protein [Actinomadura madurae]|uniref:SRPBCC family protein n=1 Tax=Actinomadura madurae TaxID=1993 RepID=UPI0020D1F7A1|nr:SRPBCC family protein [Actinomadura madurae]MCP9969863.1 SRPBCC family protein [Actinomadura madurae]
MELDHDFTVPVPVDQAWQVLLDVERVAACMPGATLDSAEGEEFAGRMKVKVGAMTITYRGTARIVSADESARVVTMEASGKEARGSGTAAATVQARLHEEDGTTRVTVHTKLNVTGRPGAVRPQHPVGGRFQGHRPVREVAGGRAGDLGRGSRGGARRGARRSPGGGP